MLSGKVAIVTGASSGIGKAIADIYSKNGADVVLAARSIEISRDIAKRLRKRDGTDPVALQIDVEKEDDPILLLKETIKKYGKVDILANVAGFVMKDSLWRKAFHSISDAELLKVMDVDLMGTFRCCKAAIPHMKARRSGVIICISSTPALAGYGMGAPYTIAKAGILGMVKHIAYEYGPFNIRAYALALGNIKTPTTFDHLTKEQKLELAKEAPLRRWGSPEEVAGTALILASEHASFVTGQTIIVDGGTVMR